MSSGYAEKKAVVLCSGGIDSATAMAIARREGFQLYVLSFTYGQRHAIELEAAKRVVSCFPVKKHLICPVDLSGIGGSALTDDIPVPKAGNESGQATGSIPATYVPARNTIFLSYSLAWAEVIGADDIFIGVNAIDYSGYPDCRPEYIEAFEKTANLALKATVEGARTIRIRAPLIRMTKAEIIQTGTDLGVDYSMTLSCYDPSPEGLACGLCDSCRLRKKGFAEAGIEDPTGYV